MYELIILSFLARWPLHGYLIAKIINDMIGPYARLSNGRLYPLLAKLEAEGLIAAAEGAEPQPTLGRRQRVYTITEAGRLRFHTLMLDTTSNPGEYQRIFWYKVPCLSLLDLHERLYLLDHYITYCQTHIFHLTAEIEDLRQHYAQRHPASADELASTLCAMEHMLRLWRLELDDVMQWRARVVAGVERVDASNTQAEAHVGAATTSNKAQNEHPTVNETSSVMGDRAI